VEPQCNLKNVRDFPELNFIFGIEIQRFLLNYQLCIAFVDLLRV